MGADQSQNQSPLFCRLDGEPPEPAQAFLFPFASRQFPFVNVTFHPPAGLFPINQILIHI